MDDSQFAERWVVNLLESIDANLKEEDKLAMMESCGRACAREGALREVQDCRGHLDRLLAKMKDWIGEENVQRRGNEITLVYTKCYCRLVAKGPARLSRTYCFCSRGWLKEVFETVTGRPIDVELKESIKSGAAGCRFVVRL